MRVANSNLIELIKIACNVEMAFLPQQARESVSYAMHATYLAAQAVVRAGWKCHPPKPSQGPFSCLRPMMLPTQHLSAVGRVPPCETAKLLSLRHLSPSIFTKINQPPTEIKTSLPRNLNDIDNQSPSFAFYSTSWPSGCGAPNSVSKCRPPGLLVGSKRGSTATPVRV
jgi:hypothetical protein